MILKGYSAAFTESTEPDLLQLGLMNLSAISHVDVEQQANLTQAGNTDQSLIQIADKTQLPDDDAVSLVDMNTDILERFKIL